MTRFFDASTTVPEECTVFTHIVESNESIRELSDDEYTPEEYDNVTMIIKNDEEYGDVFIAWDNGEEDDKILFFGKAGREFNETE